MPRTVKVAVVGSGLAGLTVAHLLSNTELRDLEFEVHVFEKVDCTSESVGCFADEMD